MPDLSLLTVTLAELAAALGRKPDALKRAWRRMHRDTGFPPPLPGGHWVWSRAAVERWLRATGSPFEAPAPANDDVVVPGDRAAAIVAAQRAALQARYGGNP